MDKISTYPIEKAVINGCYQTVKSLIDNGCDLTQYDNYACIYAASMGRAEILDLLLYSGANGEVKDYDGYTPLHWAAQENKIECIRILLKHHCPINVLDQDGQTPLYVAAGENHLILSSLLLKSGADVDLTTDTSPFQIANAFEHLKMCDLLLKYGANIDFKDSDGRTALFYAIVRKKDKLISYLIEHNAKQNSVDNYGISIDDLNDPKLRLRLYKELF